MKEPSLATSWQEVVRALMTRFDRDYQHRVAPFAEGLETYGTSTMVGVDIRFGGRVGPIWVHQVRYANRLGLFGLFGPRACSGISKQLNVSCGRQLSLGR